MKKLIKLNTEGIVQIKKMLKTLENGNETSSCPYFLYSMLPTDKDYELFKTFKHSDFPECMACHELFPRSITFKTDDSEDCPCYCYTSKYLIRRLKAIIKYNEERNKKINKF